MKYLFFLLTLVVSSVAIAQVGIGTTTPNPTAILDLESTSKGFLPPRMTSAQRNAIVSPATGLIVYNTTIGCLQINDGTSVAPIWNCISGNVNNPSTNGTGVVSGYVCTTGSAGTMTAGVPVSGVTQTITATVTTAGTYNIVATSAGVTFSGSGTFASTGAQNIVLTASGTPLTAGSNSFTLNTTPNCSFNRTVDGNITSGGSAVVSAYVCTTGTAGTLTAGVPVSGVTQTITATVTTAGTYNIIATAQGVTFAAQGTFASTGNQNVVLTATGTPLVSGFVGFTLNTTPGCNFTRTILNNPSTNGTGAVSAYVCNTASAGTLTAGTAVSGVTQTITATVTTVGTYIISATANGVTFAGSGTFAATGAQNIILTATGTPTANGTNSFAINTTPGCSFDRTTGNNPSTNGTGVVSAYNCGTASAGTLTIGTPVSGVTQTITATVTTVGTYAISTTANGVTFAGSGTFAGTGAQNIVLTATGTPTAVGTNSFAINTTPGCSFNRATGNHPSTNGTGVVSAYNCSTSSAGTLIAGTAVSGVTQTITATVTTVGTYTISTTANGVTFAGSGTFAGTGAQNIVLTATGTPTASGTNSFAINTTPGCSFNRTTIPNLPLVTQGSGTFTGRTCFDVALSNNDTNSCGTLASRTANQANFTSPATHTQSYVFTPTGSVSNVRFFYTNEVGNAVIGISGTNSGNNINTAVTATVNYNTNNNTLATGLTNSSTMITKIYAVYNINSTNNNNPADDRKVELSSFVKDCSCCMAKMSDTTYKSFLCHNLGANIALNPHVPNVGLHGGYIQFGKRGPNTTGDSRVDWFTSSNQGTNGFAKPPTASDPNGGQLGNWSQTKAALNSWNSGTESSPVKTANDPCPAGYRIPTRNEWVAVANNNVVTRTGPFTNGDDQYGSVLHLGTDATTKMLTIPAAGTRNGGASSGALVQRGGSGFCWSSTPHTDNENIYLFAFNASTVFSASPSGRLYGDQVRCIAE